MAGIIESCETKYNEALKLLSIPSQENIDKARLIMSKLAAEDKYLPAIKWMANYNETVRGDYKEAAFWYKQSLEKQAEQTVSPKTELPEEHAVGSKTSVAADTTTVNPLSSSQAIERVAYPHDSKHPIGEYGSNNSDARSTKKKKDLFIGIAIVLALLLGLGAWGYFVFFSINRVELNCNRIELATSDKATVIATVYPERLQGKAKIKWFSSDPKVATVDEEGTITAVSGGVCNITAKAGGKSAMVEVLVNQVESPDLTTEDKPTPQPTPQPTPEPTKTVQPTATPRPTEVLYTITLNKDGGGGGTSSVKVSKGSNMPNASAPTRSGYIFKGYYSKKNGEGQQYYDSNMNSVHKWDKDSNGTLYAYWKINRQSFSQKLAVGSYAYTKIVSIQPKYLIYEENEEWGYAYVCKCKTSGGSTVWIYIECSDYWDNFDDNAGNHVGYWGANKISFSSAKKINGKVMFADSKSSGLSDKLGVEKILKFTSISG